MLKKYVDYVVVSGYVSILFGRSRGTEDIDILIKKIDIDTFTRLHKELIEKGYWFLNADDPKELYEMLDDMLAIRAAAKNTVIPNIEIKFVKSELDVISLNEHNVVKVGKESINISPIELQILKNYIDILKVSGIDYGINL